MNTQSSPPCRRLINCVKQTLKGHPLVCLALAAMLVFATLTLRVLAQQGATTTDAAALEMVVTLYEQGDYREAQLLFAAVATNGPLNGTAQAYDALCRYHICRAAATNDYRWFMDALKSPALQQAELPDALREELAFSEIDARYKSRQFDSEQNIPLIAAYQTNYPASARLAALKEYELAAWFERGLQRLYSASMDETKRFHKTWTNGVAHLEQFLALVNAFPQGDYAVLKDRSLAEDLQVTLALMGEEPGALPGIPVRDVVNRQRYGLIRVALHQKLHPEASEQNLQLLADASADLQVFPVSRERARMKRQLAAFAFRTGGRFCAEAAGVPPTEPQAIAAKRAVASRYFRSARAVHGQMVKMDWSHTSHTDAALLWTDFFHSYYLEGDYAGLMTATAALLTNSAPDNPKWLAAKLYQGVALYHQDPPQPQAAAAAFEEVMARGDRRKIECRLFAQLTGAFG